ncbi:MAG: aminopeptidase P family N-terminal domain-containing protein, partial [Waltera sp.]|uniref:aminopeptidase P family N-terminal domain-containing protein n=1 Tax=Waltera sp. TaxID=2815806 RepID=UPI0039918A89
MAGKSVEEKLTQTREKMAKDCANALLLTKLDDLMWLFNIRGCDVECNPVAMSYAYITEDTATLFIQQKALDTQVSEYLAAHHINVKEYDTVVDFLKSLPAGNVI